MQKSNSLTRRKAIGVLSGVAVTATAGCTDKINTDRLNNERIENIKDDLIVRSGPEEDPDNPPEPSIETVNAHVSAFRETEETSTVYALVRNNGGVGEVRLEGKARGDVAIYDEGTQEFSLEPEQELQIRLDFQTHEGADRINIDVHSTSEPDNSDSFTISEEETPDVIDYTVD